jgi:large repetitive protein
MKQILLLLATFLLACSSLFAQAPQRIPYQAVARDAGGHLLSGQSIGVRFSILDGAIDGPVVYSESHSTQTSTLGLFTVSVGQGIVISGSFPAIDWGNGSKFLRVELDPGTGGYIDMGTSQMLSVPYALYAERAGNANLNLNFYFADRDGDGLGDRFNNYYGPYALNHYVADSTDCDDTVPYPGGVFFLYADLDGDGYGDASALVESCDGNVPGYADNDDDCDDSNSGVPLTYYIDADGDGWGGESQSLFCYDVPPGYTLQPGDCDDTDPDRNPDAGCGICSPQDLDWLAQNEPLLFQYIGECYLQCINSGNAEECIAECLVANTPLESNCAECLNGYISCLVQSCQVECLQPGPACQLCQIESGCRAVYVSCTGLTDEDLDGSVPPYDCDDQNASIYPGAPELCDGIDNDCDGQTDEGAGLTWYPDFDQDGFGSDDGALTTCNPPAGYVGEGGDCDDGNPAVFPGNGCEGCNPQLSQLFAENQTQVLIAAFSCVQAGYSDPESFAYCLSQSFPDFDVICSSCILESVLCGYYNCDFNCDPASPAECFSCAQQLGCLYLLSACITAPDSDGDGWFFPSDCDDQNPSSFPWAPEICDGQDNDCDGAVELNTTWYEDADADGYGNSDVFVVQCEQPFGYSPHSNDCNDQDATIYPGAFEACDGVDNDCSGSADDFYMWYPDADQDGWGALEGGVISCDAVDGFVPNTGDCDDDNSEINPGMPDICGDGIDQNCDGQDEVLIWYPDLDGDGFGDSFGGVADCVAPEGYIQDGSDCDDTNASINPGMAEQCDGQDNDCDGIIDNNAGSTWYFDGDGDGFGNSLSTMLSCEQPFGYVAVGGDCNDQDPTVNISGGCQGCGEASAAFIRDNFEMVMNDAQTCLFSTGFQQNAFTDCLISAYPIIEESCATCIFNSFMCIVTNCSGACAVPGEACTTCQIQSGCLSALYQCVGISDQDGDGFQTADDCDDTNPAIYPGAPEVCGDGLDNDCDGQVDEAFMIYRDSDQDGWGDEADFMLSCEVPFGYTQNPGDCDDNNPEVFPGAAEVCDDADNNCDGQVNEGLFWYPDTDGDGYGNPDGAVNGCEDQPLGYVNIAGDCDDTDAGIHPGELDICGDGIDQDCDGSDSGTTWYSDADQDGYGDPNSEGVFSCEPIEGMANNNFDCDDFNPSVNPGQPDYCDGTDNDCNGVVDDGDGQAWYPDADGDGYGDNSGVIFTCSPPAGYVNTGGDCNDNDPLQNPANGCGGGCSEQSSAYLAANYDAVMQDGQNCFFSFNGQPEAFTECLTQGHPQLEQECAMCVYNLYQCVFGNCMSQCISSPEACTQCAQENGCLDAFYQCTGLEDADQDGYLSGDDCDDSNPSIYPNAPEICGDGLDNDCDGTVDETITWYADNDQDGWGNEFSALSDCTQPEGYVLNSGDCDDSNPNVFPGAFDECDGLDNDCNGTADDAIYWFEDADGDGFGNEASVYFGCFPPDGYTQTPYDCDDSNAGVYPGAPEVCGDGIDQDCDGITDNEYALYRDADLDGWGSIFEPVIYSCEMLSGYSTLSGDCDDEDPLTHPGAIDAACEDGADQDCDGTDACSTDTDGDGLTNWEEQITLTDPYTNDTDGDSLPDGQEVSPNDLTDTDGDGLIDALDEDDDNDGIPTHIEVFEAYNLYGEDVDGDGLPNWLDPDSDGDGLSDGDEYESDLNGNGIPDYVEAN